MHVMPRIKYAALTALIDKDTVDAIYNIIDATGLLPSIPLELTEENVAANVTDPVIDTIHDAVEARLTVLLDAIPADSTATTFVSTDPFKTEMATVIADARAEVRTKVAQKVAGYSLGRADILRRAMGKKKAEVLAAEFEGFEAGMKANGFSSSSG